MAVVYRAIGTVAVEAAARHRDVMVGETTESVRETGTGTEVENARAIVVEIGTAIGTAIGIAIGTAIGTVIETGTAIETGIELAERLTDEKGNGLVEAVRQTLD